MTTSRTYSETSTFSRTSARHVASKVAADLRLMQIFYGSPSDQMIDLFEAEVVELLVEGCLGTVKYGFQRDNLWVPPVLSYVAALDGSLTIDERAGRVPRGEDVRGARFLSHLTYSAFWWTLTAAERESIDRRIPLDRSTGSEPTLGAGSWRFDRTYSRDGGGLGRSSFRSN